MIFTKLEHLLESEVDYIIYLFKILAMNYFIIYKVKIKFKSITIKKKFLFFSKKRREKKNILLFF